MRSQPLHNLVYEMITEIFYSIRNRVISGIKLSIKHKKTIQSNQLAMYHNFEEEIILSWFEVSSTRQLRLNDGVFLDSSTYLK